MYSAALRRKAAFQKHIWNNKNKLDSRDLDECFLPSFFTN